MFTKQISLHRISKAHYAYFKFLKQFLKHNITLLKAKLWAKILEISIGNKKIVVKKKKVMFLVNSYHILLAHFLLWCT